MLVPLNIFIGAIPGRLGNGSVCVRLCIYVCVCSVCVHMCVHIHLCAKISLCNDWPGGWNNSEHRFNNVVLFRLNGALGPLSSGDETQGLTFVGHSCYHLNHLTSLFLYKLLKPTTVGDRGMERMR